MGLNFSGLVEMVLVLGLGLWDLRISFRGSLPVRAVA